MCFVSTCVFISWSLIYLPNKVLYYCSLCVWVLIFFENDYLFRINTISAFQTYRENFYLHVLEVISIYHDLSVYHLILLCRNCFFILIESQGNLYFNFFFQQNDSFDHKIIGTTFLPTRNLFFSFFWHHKFFD